MLAALLGTFGLIVVAELGDKTQLLVAWLATRHRRWEVLLGVFLGSAAIHLLSAALGGTISEYVPQRSLQIAAGLLFVGFGVWALRVTDEADDVAGERRVGIPVLSIAATFFVAELGDKTQLVALSRAAQHGAEIGLLPAFWAVWIGATLGMLVADGAAVLAGSWLSGRVSHALLSRLSGVVFLAFGAYTLVTAFI
jgi:putative Ca2+/H+ antiporter (TMEM165/GDT1 family)